MFRKRVKPKRKDLGKAPSEVLKRYMEKYKYTNTKVAALTGRSDAHISNILNDKATVTISFALDLEKVFPKVSAEFWVILNAKYQLGLARLVQKSILLR